MKELNRARVVFPENYMNQNANQKAYITIGLPGSGKSTWSKSMTDVAIVNKDTIRKQLSNGKPWTPQFEKEVIKEQNRLITNILNSGYNLIVDNTHLNPKTLNAVQSYIKNNFPNVEIIIKDFRDIPVYICIERDRLRESEGTMVGAKVIMEMARKAGLETEIVLEEDPNLAACVMVDLDGTLALFGNRRNPYDASNCHETDIPHPFIHVILNMFFFLNNYKIFFFTGRDDRFKDSTIKFLNNVCGFKPEKYSLVMRKTGDKRKDSIVKEEMYNEHIKGKYNVLGVIDDRPVVCKMWRSLGLPLLQAGLGDSVEF